MVIIGLCGNHGVGKSTIAAAFNTAADIKLHFIRIEDPIKHIVSLLKAPDDKIIIQLLQKNNLYPTKCDVLIPERPVKTSFAAVLKIICAALANTNYFYFSGDDEYRILRETHIISRFKMTPRQFLIHVGTVFRKQYDPNVWVKTLDIRPGFNIVDDLRFINEYEFFKCVGGIVIYLQNDRGVPNTSYEMTADFIEKNDIQILNTNNLSIGEIKSAIIDICMHNTSIMSD